jgi:hypothetical protein
LTLEAGTAARRQSRHQANEWEGVDVYIRVRTAAVMAALLALAGCSSSGRSTGAGGAEPNAAAGCVDVKVDVGQTPGTKELVITGALRKTIDGNRTGTEPSVLRDAPVRPAVTWTTARPLADAALFAAIPIDLMTEPSPPTTQIDQFLKPLHLTAGTYVGYASVQKIAVPFGVDCADGRTFAGTLATWTESEVGLVRCGLLLEAEAPPEATQAQREFCTA